MRRVVTCIGGDVEESWDRGSDVGDLERIERKVGRAHDGDAIRLGENIACVDGIGDGCGLANLHVDDWISGLVFEDTISRDAASKGSMPWTS